MEARGAGGHDRPPWVPVPGMALDEQAEMFAGIAMSSPDGVIASDLRGTIVWVNPVAADMFGRPREELLGRPFTVLLPQEAHAWVRSIVERILEGEQTTPLLTTGLRRNGETFDLSASPGVRRDARGRLVGTTMTLRDVTDEVRMQRELTEALARSRARFDQSAHPQALLDLQGRFVEVNDAVCELLGRPREELVGRDSAELIHPTDPGLVRVQLDRLREGSMHAASYETTALSGDGSQVPLLVDITAVRDVEGRAYEFAAFARDLRELREVERRLASQEAFFRALSREASDVTVVSDTEGNVLHVTPSVTQVLGYQPDQLTDVLSAWLVDSEDPTGQEERSRRLREVPGTRERFTVRLPDSEGRWRWFETTATNCVQDPHIAGVVVNLREVTPEIEAQQALRDSEARYRAIAETAQEGILAISPEGEILFANERLAGILGLSMPEVYAFGGRALFKPAEAAQAARRLAERGRGAGPERSDFPYRHPDGSDRVLHVSASALTAADGSVLGSLAMVADVTDQRAAEESLRRQALHDALTGLPNRLLFLDRLETAAARQERTDKRAIAVLFLDVDHFKVVNDTHGHQVGDRLLVEVAARVAKAVRASDTVARLGGDEFAVICEGADRETAALVASRIQHSFKEPVALDGDAIAASVSIGVALSPPHDAGELLRYADTAMYRAKAHARGSVVTYEEEDGADSPARRPEGPS